MKRVAWLVTLQLALALAHAQAPPAPVCNHQWIPNGAPSFGPPTLACSEKSTPAYTDFTVTATENYNGYVYPYQGNDTQCTTEPVELTLSGQCGGTNTDGQVVTCMPQNPGYSESSVSDSVTTIFEYQQFVETGSPGKITCVYSGMIQQKTSPVLSASTAGCNCPCPSSSGKTLTFNPASPITTGTTTAISPPSGFSYVSGTSAYTSSDTSVVTINNPTTAYGVAPGSSYIGSSGLVYSPTSSYVANGCSVSSTILQVTCAGSPNFECADGGTPVCLQGGWGCSNGDTPCLLPMPTQGCHQGNEGWQCYPDGQWTCVNNGSPIIIDTKGQGFHLTGVADGVQFPFFPGKPPVQISWTDANYSNGWLALDRNGNGKIDSAAELFGNLTSQPPSADPNGYAALAVFDDPANGGNGNGMIDTGDQIFGKLLVWIDSNHDGISQPSELHSLRDVGVSVISLHYTLSPYVDQFGNQFRYRAPILDEAGVAHDRCYDVFLNYTAVK